MKLKNIQKDIYSKLYCTAEWHWDNKTIFTREMLSYVSDILSDLANVSINSKTWKSFIK